MDKYTIIFINRFDDSIDLDVTSPGAVEKRDAPHGFSRLHNISGAVSQIDFSGDSNKLFSKGAKFENKGFYVQLHHYPPFELKQEIQDDIKRALDQISICLEIEKSETPNRVEKFLQEIMFSTNSIRGNTIIGVEMKDGEG